MRKLKYQEENSKMAITNISLLGLVAEGAVAYYVLRQTLPSNQIAVLASGERASRLKSSGIIINDIPYSLWVRPAGETSVYGNPTEIDMFMGEALRLGNRYHVKLPVCRFVYDIITSMEKARKFA